MWMATPDRINGTDTTTPQKMEYYPKPGLRESVDRVGARKMTDVALKKRAGGC
jgi:hypothetical protein